MLQTALRLLGMLHLSSEGCKKACLQSHNLIVEYPCYQNRQIQLQRAVLCKEVLECVGPRANESAAAHSICASSTAFPYWRSLGNCLPFLT